jgi:hypothetical protein
MRLRVQFPSATPTMQNILNYHLDVELKSNTPLTGRKLVFKTETTGSNLLFFFLEYAAISPEEWMVKL